MKELEDIKQGLAAFASQYGPAAILPATVLSVNEDEATAHVKFSSGLEIQDARLRSVVTNNAGMYALPEENSIVQVARIENSEEWIVVAMAAVNKVVVKKGADTLKDVLTLIIEATQQIAVLYGNNPNYAKLSDALTKTNNLF